MTRSLAPLRLTRACLSNPFQYKEMWDLSRGCLRVCSAGGVSRKPGCIPLVRRVAIAGGGAACERLG